jgi:hypothetical protein
MYISVNVTLRRVRATTAAVEKQQVSHILCVCVVCLALVIRHAMHAPYYTVICGLSDCTIFFHIIS